MIVTEQEISELKDFVFELNSMTDSVVVVEGKRDSNALRRIGYQGGNFRISQIWRNGKFCRLGCRLSEADHSF